MEEGYNAMYVDMVEVVAMVESEEEEVVVLHKSPLQINKQPTSQI